MFQPAVSPASGLYRSGKPAKRPPAYWAHVLCHTSLTDIDDFYLSASTPGIPSLTSLFCSPALCLHFFSPLLSSLSPPPLDSDCDGEVNPAGIWLPSVADLPIMVDGQCRLITIFDPPWNPQLAWLWFPRIAASLKWGGPAALEVILGLLLKPQRIPIVFASIGNDWRLCFCAVSGAGISSNCAALLANFVPSRPLSTAANFWWEL